MVEKWVGKIAIVTGCCSGIGAAVFNEFIKHKIKVIGLDVQEDKINKIAAESDDSFYAFYCNIANPDSVTECFRKIEDQFGVVHILVNCAGIGR